MNIDDAVSMYGKPLIEGEMGARGLVGDFIVSVVAGALYDIDAGQPLWLVMDGDELVTSHTDGIEACNEAIARSMCSVDLSEVELDDEFEALMYGDDAPYVDAAQREIEAKLSALADLSEAYTPEVINEALRRVLNVRDGAW